VIGLIEEIGFDGVDAGGLDASWRQQPGSAAYCTHLGASRLKEVMQGLNRRRPRQARRAPGRGVEEDVGVAQRASTLDRDSSSPFAKDSVPLLRSLAGLPD